jgi:hypothetical protein
MDGEVRWMQAKSSARLAARPHRHEQLKLPHNETYDPIKYSEWLKKPPPKKRD